MSISPNYGSGWAGTMYGYTGKSYLSNTISYNGSYPNTVTLTFQINGTSKTKQFNLNTSKTAFTLSLGGAYTIKGNLVRNNEYGRTNSYTLNINKVS